TSGIISTIVGDGVNLFSGDGGPASAARVYRPYKVKIDNNGNILIADTWNYRVRRIDHTTGIITTIAGSGATTFSGDGGQATSAGMEIPLSVASDASGNLYIPTGNRIRRVDAGSGIITTVVGNGIDGYFGDGGLAVNASINAATGIAFDDSGNYF